MSCRAISCLAGAITLLMVQGAVAQTCRPDAPYSVPIDRATKAVVLDSLYSYMGHTYVYPDKTDEAWAWLLASETSEDNA